MITLKQIYTLLFLLGIFFIPFNEFDGLSFLGEYKDEAASYFFLLGFAIAVVENLLAKKIHFPYKHPLIVLLILFIVWTFVSTMLNYETVSTNFYKQTSGINRYIRQTISLMISAGCFTFLFWNVIKDLDIVKSIKLIRKVILYSFVFVSVYAFIEIAIVFFGMGFLRPVLGAFEFFPFVNNSLHTGHRVGISSVTYEIPALGNYLIFVTPWMLSYIFTEKKVMRFVPITVILILTFFSDARAALIVISMQLFLFLLVLLHDERFRLPTINILKIGAVAVFAILMIKGSAIINTAEEKLDRINFSKNLTQSISNKSRFGMQHAALEVFKENPVCGVGFGQGAYHMVPHYPYWATANNWEFKYLYKNQQLKSFPPQFNIYTRLLSEVGLVGSLLFLGLVAASILYALMYWVKINYTHKYIGSILFLSLVGIVVNWLQIDTFRQYGFWLSLILLIKALYQAKNHKLN